jgi:hypothetical protein
VAHVSETLDPLDDIAVLATELVLADLAVVERRIDKLHTAAKASPRAHADELAWLERLRQRLDRGETARGSATDDLQRSWAAEVALVTAKPCLYVANVDESSLPVGGPLAAQVRAHAAADGAPCVVLSADLEYELTRLDPAEAVEYRAALGLVESGLPSLIRTGYDLLGLVTFFTTTGGHTVQAWTVPAGTTAPHAAGTIHGDMERGFIRAEVVSFDALRSDHTLANAREHGHLRLEGREYMVHDGDIIHFRFAV